jgi:RNA polymerase sigma factor (sigma-70 family)
MRQKPRLAGHPNGSMPLTQYHPIVIDGYHAGAVGLSESKLIAVNRDWLPLQAFCLPLNEGAARGAAVARMFPAARRAVEAHFAGVRRLKGEDALFLQRYEPTIVRLPRRSPRMPFGGAPGGPSASNFDRLVRDLGSLPRLSKNKEARIFETLSVCRDDPEKKADCQLAGRKLVEAYTPLIFKLARQLCKAQEKLNLRPEEVLGELIVGMYKKLDAYNPSKASFATFVRQVCKSSFADYTRKIRLTEGITGTNGAMVLVVSTHDEGEGDDGSMMLEEVLQDIRDVEASREGAQIASLAAAAVEILAPQEYQIFAGLAFECKSIADLAADMGVSTQRIYTLKLIAVSKLKDYYGTLTYNSAECA